VRMEKVYQSLIIPMLLTYIKFEPNNEQNA